MKMSDPSFHHHQPSAAVTALIKQLNDDAPGIRRTAAWELRNFPELNHLVVPALVKALDDTDDNVSTAALFALGNLGSAANAAVPELIRRAEAAERPQCINILFILERISGRIFVDIEKEPTEILDDLRRQLFPPFMLN
jgi:HEAT repeat protein